MKEMFTSSIWSQQIDGKTFEEYVKDQIRVKLIRVRCMNAMAKEKGNSSWKRRKRWR